MGDATRCATTVVDALVAHGVREVVLAPGSRSAPLAYALFAADRDNRLRLHVRIDERGAGFLALGLAKAGEHPVAVLTTSGTAAANLHPAVLEAWHSHLPLVVVTADRPRAMINTGANQTSHQAGLFTDHLRGFAGLSDAVSDPQTWRFEVGRLLSAATGVRSRLPGPVHLNVELSDPLTPTELTPAEPWAPVGVAPLGAGEPTVLEAGPRTVILAGDAPPAVGVGVAALAEVAGVPLLAEPSSNARRGSAALATYRLVLGTAIADRIERVVVFGHPTLSRPVTRLLARPDVELVVVSPYADWVDPGRRATQVVNGVRWAPGAADSDWWAEWHDLDRQLGTALAELLAGADLTGPLLARTIVEVCGDRDVLFAGSSNPIRDLDLAPLAAHPAPVYANRGLSGIDGSISTATGIALATGRPVQALLGDVTTVHDLTGLVLGPAEPRPDLRILVANDDGGSIFATLEQGAAEHADAFERVFATPHGLRFAALAAAVGAAYTRVTTAAEVRKAMASPPSGLEIVEAVVDRVHRRRLDQAITGLAATL